MNNKVIKVLDEKHGKKVIEFFKQYCDTGGLEGDNIGCYYGIIDGKFHFWEPDELRYYVEIVEIIELPEERAYPRVMLVSNDKINWKKRVVFMEKNGGFLAWGFFETLEEAEKIVSTTFWKYAKEIEPIEVTLEEIAKWKGINANQIRIK